MKEKTEFKRRTGVYGISAGVVILGIVGGSLYGMNQMGVPLGPVEAKAKKVVKEEVIPVAEYKNTSAYKVLTESLANPPGGWEKNGEMITSSQLPYPFSCVPDGTKPAMSFAQGYGANNRNLQIVTTAYTAGLGPAGIANQFNRAASCAGADVSLFTQEVIDLGAEAYVTTVNRGNSSTKIVTWRTGDVVTYLVTDNNNPDALNQATAFNNTLSERLNPVCINPNSGEDDLARSIWSDVEFKGLEVNQPVKIDQIPLPDTVDKPTIPLLGVNLQPKGFEYKSTENVVPTPIPAPTIETAFVTRPEIPAYPVWPLLPAEPEFPTEPKAPAASSPTSKDVAVKVKDNEGPGCGWAFTATVEPKFDQAAADAKKEKDQAAALAILKTDAANWQDSVLSYWKNYASYNKKSQVWNDYAAKVDVVKQAWAEIAQQWDTYNANLANYEASVQARNDFIKAKDEATKQYAADLETCKVQDARDAENEEKNAEEKRKWDEAERKRVAAETRAILEERRTALKDGEPEPTASPTPSPTPSPSPSNSPSPEPTEEEEEPEEKPLPTPRPYVPPVDTTPRITCPAERPVILDQAAPELLAKPTPPADPRPVDQRK